MSRVGGSFCVSVCSSGSTCLLLHQHPGCVCVSCSLLSGSLQPCGLQPTRLLCPWGSPGKNAGVGCHALLQGIFPIQGSDPCLLGSCMAGCLFTCEPPGNLESASCHLNCCCFAGSPPALFSHMLWLFWAFCISLLY